MPANGEMTGKTDGFSSGEFQMLPAGPEDAESIQSCSWRANSNNYAHTVTYPEDKAHLTSPEEMFQYRVDRLRKAMHEKDMLHFKMTPKDNPTCVIGHAAWYMPGHFKGEESLLKASDKPAEEFPASMNVDVHKDLLAKLDEQRKVIWGEESNYWYLAALSVDPSYQRKGLASALVKTGLDRADADDLPTYLEATPEGALFYPRVGFQKIAEHGFFDGKFVAEFHLRPAGGIKN